MYRNIFILFIIVSLISCGNTNVSLYDLRCENLENPLGIDTKNPRFSWKIKAKKNCEQQTAYRILVANDAEFSTKECFFSTNGTNDTHSFYEGKGLKSGCLYYWKVQIKDRDGKFSDWSKPAFFSVGLLDSTDWKCDYIGFPENMGDAQSPLLKKNFEVNEKYDNSLIHINSLGYFEVFINGKNISNEPLAPAVSQFNKRSLSRTYNVTNFLKKGQNEIEIHLSRGWYQKQLPGCVYDGPAVRAQIELLNNKNDDRKVILATDDSWQVSESGCTLTSRWGYASFGGEKIDATKKTHWIQAAKINIPPHKVSPQMCEGNIFAEIYNAKEIKQLSDSVFLFDIGTTLTGMIKIKFPQLQANQEIRLDYCDHLENDEFINYQGQTDFYIASGEKDEIFRNRFNYHSFRYIKISGLTTAPALENITAKLVRTGYKDASTFECSDGDLNAIHDMIKHTLHCLSLGGYIVDCHHIERLGYGGDGHASTTTFQTFANLAPLYSNWLNAWADCIREDGGLPHTAPNPYPAGGGPYWCAFIVSAPWSYYVNYGDLRILEKFYPVMKHWVQYIDKYTVNGLLKNWGDNDYRAWYLGDWAAPKGIDHTNPASIDLVDNCVVSECFSTLEKIALLLDNKEDADEYLHRKIKLDSVIHSTFFSADSVKYATGSQIDNIYPILAGVAPAEIVPALTQRIFDDTEQKYDGNIATGLVGIQVMVDWVIKNNFSDFIYKMLKKRDYPSYLYMIDNGATATWEHWDGRRSHIHNCFNGIGAWFYQAIGGIQPDETGAGYRKVRINPQIPDGVDWAKVSKETPLGAIVVNWEKIDGKIKFDINIPVGCTADFEYKDKKIQLENGKHKIF
jgi:alpha-L-rhamnosidase